MDKEKTLKNLKEDWKKQIINETEIQKAVSEGGIEFSYTGELIPLEIVESDLKEQTIKWVKEDLNILDEGRFIDRKPIAIIERWMDRLNITEKDLK